MSTFDRERKSSHWFWLLALLILAVMLYVFFHLGFFPGTNQTREQSRAAPVQSRSQSPQKLRTNESSNAANSQTPAAPGQLPPAAVSPADGEAQPTAIKVVVLNEATRAPVDDATVRVYAHSSPPSVVEKTTASDGTSQIDVPAAFRYGVAVEAEGFRPYQEDSFVITRPSYNIVVLLTPTFGLRGRVVDNVAAGIADALVQLRRGNERSPAILATTTDQQGTFAFRDIPQSGRYSVEAIHPAYDAQGIVNTMVPTDSDVEIRMRPVQPSGSLSGTVSDSARKPIAGAAISLLDPANGRMWSQMQTDAQGSYRFAKMREGIYVVRCAADGYLESRANQGAVAITASKEAHFDFSLDAGQQIRGIVVNQKGEPVEQAQVIYSVDNPQMQRGRGRGQANADDMAGRMGPRGNMQGARNMGVATTDDEGRFQIQGASDTQYQVSVSHRDYQSLVTRLRPSSQTQTLTLDSGLSLLGTVSDAQGAAVEKFTFAFQLPSTRSEKTYSFTTTDGRFEIRGLARGLYQVMLQPAGRERYSGTLDLQTSTEVFVVLDSSGGGRGAKPLVFQKAR